MSDERKRLTEHLTKTLPEDLAEKLRAGANDEETRKGLNDWVAGALNPSGAGLPPCPCGQPHIILSGGKPHWGDMTEQEIREAEHDGRSLWFDEIRNEAWTPRPPFLTRASYFFNKVYYRAGDAEKVRAILKNPPS